MTALLHAEVRKLAATRSWLLLAAAPILYPLLTVVVLALSSGDRTPDFGPDSIVRGGADVATFAMLILGILSVAGEYRHGTVVPSLLAAPQRVRFITAKLTSQASLAAAVALVATVVALVTGGLYLASQNVTLALFSGDVALTALGVVLVTVFYSTAGAALGAIVRNQTAAITGALLWLLAIEEVVPIVLRQPGLRRWLPGGATTRLLHLADPGPAATSVWGAALLLLAIVATLVAAAIATTARTDID